MDMASCKVEGLEEEVCRLVVLACELTIYRMVVDLAYCRLEWEAEAAFCIWGHGVEATS